MRKSSKKQKTGQSSAEQKKIEKQKQKIIRNKINMKKQQLTVDVIQYNHIMQKLKRSIVQSLGACNDISQKSFTNQRNLIARKMMSERVLNAALKMIDNNKLYLWMIDEQSLKEDNK